MQIISLLIILIFFFQGIEATSVSAILKEIPKEDRESINHLFSFFIKEDHFAYTLFGDKPISLSAHFIITPWENIVERVNDQDEIFWKNWNVWKKYQHLFSLKDFILINEPSKNNKNISNVILINKKEFIRVISQNQRLFEAVLGYSVLPHRMLKKIEFNKMTFVDSINDNQGLWGILLGYGKHNSMLYNQRHRNYFNCLALSESSLRNSSIKLKGSGDNNYSPLIIGSVYFVGDITHPETKALQKKYRELRGKISAIYSKGDFLEITLSKLTE